MREITTHLNDLAGGGDLHPRGRGGVAQLGQAGPDLRRPAGEQNLHATRRTQRERAFVMLYVFTAVYKIAKILGLLRKVVSL